MALGVTPGCWGCGFAGAALEEGPDKVLGPCFGSCLPLGPCGAGPSEHGAAACWLLAGSDGSAKPYSPKQKSRR